MALLCSLEVRRAPADASLKWSHLDQLTLAYVVAQAITIVTIVPFQLNTHPHPQLDTAARKMVLYSVPAALGELWRSTDPSYVSPRKRLGIMPESRLPKSLRDRAEAGTWMHRNVAVPLSRLAHEVAMGECRDRGTEAGAGATAGVDGWGSGMQDGNG